MAEWARGNGVYPQTAYRWFRGDRMPVAARRLESGTIWVDAPVGGEAGRTVVYTRVSSHDQRQDLDRQVARLADWATSNGYVVGEVVCEVGSGLNRKRPKMRRILSDPCASVVVMEHRDRLARSEVEDLEAALSAHGRTIIVADQGETTDDLVRDMIEVLTAMCARLYGRRGARNRAMRAVTATKEAAAVADG
ncbi:MULTISPECIES: IS607 family transposase [Mycolicibacterium]|uniref:IS607 family transposase n=1 Tax=Mycolicibacterium TaxID=1866885 RepID=UPI000CF87C3B|nr:IS607 family transposase [Mycolicibacterium austroafricanum]PQP52519.1 IS607 family transposase [Mycolicibacterium austroafricanum]QZT58535.1 IS607 family transposase [Mycolicibacterium austroafricanum]